MSPKKLLVFDLCCQILFFGLFMIILNDYHWIQNRHFIGLSLFLGYQWLVSPFTLGFYEVGNFTKLRQFLFFTALFLASFATGLFLINNPDNLVLDFNQSAIFWIFLCLGIFYSLLYFLGSLLDLFLEFRPQLKSEILSKSNLPTKVSFLSQTSILILGLLLWIIQPSVATIILFLTSFWQFAWTCKLKKNQNPWHLHFNLSLANMVIFALDWSNDLMFFVWCFLALYLNYLRLLWGKIVN